ncbi:MAG: SDR family oxidoreductase [Gammaproteobacteria bacterium]|nr:SDR family oxidoreductase [Gammaproteobacteria bacterium]
MAYWITGAGHFSGIGSAVALHLLKNNNNVVINSRTIDKAWYDYKNYFGDNLQIVKGDITDTNIQNKFISYVYNFPNFSKFDGLINNASTVGQYNNIKREDWNREFLINVIVPYELSLKAKPYLEASNGAIVNIGSRVGLQVAPSHNMVYGVAKAAEHQLTLSMAAEFAPNIRVNALLPGCFVSARLQDKFGENTDKIIENYKKKSLLNSVLDEQEIVKSVVFLLENKNITGQLLPICNGASVNLA